MKFETISLIGLGYIGLPTGAVLASRMGRVLGVDVKADVVDAIMNGTFRTMEPGLTELLAQVRESGALCAVTRPEPADAFIIAVPTPITDDHKPDISFVRSAALSLASVLRPGNLIILESTSPVGTTEQMAAWLAEARPDLTFPQHAGETADIQIAYCPERILPGKMLDELVHNDRVVGGMTQKASEMASSLYKIFVDGEILTTSVRTAELCKLAENSFRDVNIAYANELSIICDKLDIDVQELIHLANRHPRVNILQPSCGVGGHCIPVDPWFIVDSAPEEARLIRASREVNDGKPDWVVNKIKQSINIYLQMHPEKALDEITIACYGLAYKEGTDDLRNSPAIQVLHKIDQIGCKIIIVAKNLKKNFSSYRNVIKCVDNDVSADNVDIFCVLVPGFHITIKKG